MFKRNFLMDQAGDGTGAGAGTGAGGAGEGAGAGAAPAAFDWAAHGVDAAGLNVVTTKGWKAPGDLLGSYVNLEKLVGAPPERIVKLPAEMNDETMGEVWDRLGRPKTAAEYKIPVPEGDSGEFAKTAAEWFHKAGLTAGQAEKLALMNNEFVAAQSKAQLEAYNQTVAADTLKLKTEWGAKHDDNLTVARTAAKTFGIDEATFSKLEQGMGFAQVHRLFYGIGSKLGEAEFLQAGGKPGEFGGTSPESAQAQIVANRKDPAFAARFNSADPTVRGEARALMARLTKIAYPD